MGTRAAIYCRISKDAAGLGLGVDRQRADCEALADRSGWEVAGVYADNDISAYSGQRRPDYERLCDDLKEGLVDVVLAWDPDRLHRSPAELERFIDLIEASGAKVATVNSGEVDLSSASGRMTARVVGAVARHESEHKSERLRRKHLELAQNGQISGGGRRPFGYERDRRTIRPAEADLVRTAVDQVLAGASIRSVVADWRDQGVRTVTGAPWSSTTVKRLLASGRISGRREHHGQIVGPAEWPAIIDPADSDRIRAVLSDPTRNRVAGVAARSYLLAGFVYCGRCQVKMTSRSTARSKPRYVCVKDRGGCDRCGISAAGLEELVVDAVLAVLDTPALARAVATVAGDAAAGPMDDLAGITERLAELSKDYYDDRLITRGEYVAARQALEARQRAAQDRLVESTRPNILAGIEDGTLRAAWPDLSIDRRRAVLGQVLDQVTITPTERANNRFDPARVTIEWKV